jgi:hypothetical protein
MYGFSLFLAWLAMIASLILATDWCFIEYVLDALNLRTARVAPAGFSAIQAVRIRDGGQSPPGPEKVTSPRAPHKPKRTTPAPDDRLIHQEAPEALQEAKPWWSGTESTSTTLDLDEDAEIQDGISSQESEFGLQESEFPAGIYSARTEEHRVEALERERLDEEGPSDLDEGAEEEIVTEDFVDEEEPLEPEGEEEEAWEDEEAGLEEEIDEDEIDLVDGEEPLIEEGEEEEEEWQEADTNAAEEETVLEDEGVQFSTVSADEEQKAFTDQDIPSESQDLLKEDESSIFSRAAKLVFETEDASIPFLQKNLGLGYYRAAKLLNQLEKRGIIAPYEEGQGRRIVISGEELVRLLDL